MQLGEEELILFMKRTIQGVFVRHHDRTRTIFTHYQEWNCARQKLDKTDLE